MHIHRETHDFGAHANFSYRVFQNYISNLQVSKESLKNFVKNAILRVILNKSVPGSLLEVQEK